MLPGMSTKPGEFHIGGANTRRRGHHSQCMHNFHALVDLDIVGKEGSELPLAS